ncbi:hypothetical protein ES703_108997 [subsurface metagenome]
MPVSQDCLEKAYHIYEVHEYAHAASREALSRDKKSAEMYLDLINQELYAVAVSLSAETKMELSRDLAEARKLIYQEDKQAVLPLGRFLDKTKELMFEVAVACECRKGGQ